ncbi:MAG: hypothetical protein DIJKHBIC_01685 [Thermoanaerobaculia bacterium]|nr:hypothetical protein [Thermoanaerobaculia bacterium]
MNTEGAGGTQGETVCSAGSETSMAHISHLPFLSHLRAQPNQYVLHYRRGRLVRKGAGLAYWFSPLSAAIAEVPVEDIETTFLLTERSSDYQDVTVQCTLIYRCQNPERTAERVNFTISLKTGLLIQQPLERLASFWAQRAQQAGRSYLTGVPVVEAIRSGAEVIRARMEESLKKDPEIEAMGLSMVSIQVRKVAPSAELEKALQTPAREALQQKADEAVFERRALAVEKERAIKENELASEIELARRQELLIQQRGANKLLEVQKESAAQKAKVESDGVCTELAARDFARDVAVRASGEAEAARTLAAARHEAEEKRIALFTTAPARVAWGLAMQEFAGKVQGIQHLNVTPDLLASALQQFLRDHTGE